MDLSEQCPTVGGGRPGKLKAAQGIKQLPQGHKAKGDVE